MKKLIALFVPLFVFACVSAPQIPADLCAEHDAEKSVLIKVAGIKQIPLNEIYYGLIDAAAIGMAVDAVHREDIQAYMYLVADWYNDNYPVSYTALINHMVDEAQAQQLVGILSRRIGDFKSYLYVSKYDDCMLRAGWNEAIDQLFLRRE